VWAAVRRLPPRQAQVFALTYVEDLPIARVAEILGITAMFMTLFGLAGWLFHRSERPARRP